MSAPGCPGPGPLTRFLLARRVDPVEAQAFMAEVAELHEHRVEHVGRAEADRWARREYRRLALRLATGSRVTGPPSVSNPDMSSDALSGLGGDVVQGLRGLYRAPLFAVAVVFTVGLGIGGTTLVFTIVHSVLIAPLPYDGAERMVLLRTIHGEQMWSTSMADLHALRETPPDAFEEIASYTNRTSRVASGAETELIRTRWVTPNYFPMLGHDPIAGRHFTEEEGVEGGPPAVLISDSYRERNFGPGETGIGRSLLIDGEPWTIVGVLADEVGPLDEGRDVFPVLKVEIPNRKGPFFFLVIGRLKEGVDPSVGRAQLAAVSERIFPIWENSFPEREAILGFVDLKEVMVGDVSRTLFIVLTAVGFLLLIASANASSLLVARGITRSREVAVRSALGASAGRVLRLLLVEAGLIALVAGGAGLAIAMAGLEIVRRVGVGHLPRVMDIGMGPTSILFFIGVTTASWALFGCIAGVATARNRTAGIAGTSGRATASPRMLLLRRLLVGAQFAITIPLLVSAGLLLQSLDQVRNESFGFDPDGVVSMLVTLPGESFPNVSDRREFWSQLLPQIEAIPGVLAAGIADAQPPLPIDGGNNFVLEDRPPAPGEPQPTAPWITADASFFATLGLRVIDGRLYDGQPTDSVFAAVVDESWAARYYPDRPAVGRRFRSGGCTVDGCPWVEIVGVVQDVKTSGLDDTRRLGTIYFDYANDSYAGMRLHLRTDGDPLAAVPAVKAAIQQFDPGIPVAQVQTPQDVADEALAGRRYTSMLVTLMAAVALLLSLVGVYGVMAYYVRQHARDIGIRIALGGGPGNALGMVVKRGMAIAVIGTVVGLALTPLLTRPLAGLLYNVSASDPVILTTVAVLTLVVALAAIALPGRRASHTDPAITLREE